MRKWKKFMAIGLAISMVTPSCMSYMSWASEFSAESSETVADVFGDNSESESGNKTGDKNNEKYEFDTGEPEKEKKIEDISDGENGSKNIILNDTEEQTPEQSEKEKEVNTGQAVEGYTIQLYSEGKIEKTYVIAYADVNDAKAPEALKGKSGYVFKEWNTKEDGSGEAYKPGDSISKLLKSENPAMQNLDSANTDSAVQDKKMGEMGSEDLNPTVESAGNTAQALSAEEEKTERASLAEEPEWTEVSKAAELVTSETTTGTNIGETTASGTTASGATTVETTSGTATIETASGPTITLYAIWEKAAEYKITYKLNKGKNNASNSKTYTGEAEIKLKNPTRSGYHFVGWYTDSKYKQKIDVIEKGSKGRITLYAKWIKEVNPSAKAASLTALKGTKAKTITASANIANYVKSVDDYYYLLYVDSNSGKVKKAAAKVKKPEMSNGKVTFKLDISGHPEYVQGKFAVGVKKSKTVYTVISSKSYVSNPEKLSSNTAAYFVPKTKKGIQATNFSEVTDTKSKNVFFNLYISDLMRKDSGVETYKYNGKTYHFNGLYGYEYLVQQCNAKGIQVTAQISIDKNASTQSLTTGNSPYAETAYYGWNTDNATTRQTMEAMFAYLGEKFGRNNCYISNWILGNEVNSASGYYYVGNVSFSKFISMYSEAFRCLYNAVRSSRGSSKVFICLDNCWNQKNAFRVCYSAKSTLDSFAAKISDIQKNVNWNLAYHAYNQPLSDPQFWSGANASMFTSDANSTTFITMRNIDTLTNYVKSRYGSNTRVILSEQGFSSTGGQANQAAALALAYYKAACNPMIDAFIVRSYKDEAHEVALGLAMGLKDANNKKKTAFNVFSNMDSSNSLKYTEKVLSSQVGSWKAQIPGYNVKRISSMYRN